MSSRGCYSREQATDLIGNKKELSIGDILDFDIPLKDKAWFIRNSCQLTINEKRQFAIGCALVVLPIYENKYPCNDAPRKAVAAAQAYLDGTITSDELYTSRRDAADYAAAAAKPISYKDLLLAFFKEFTATKETV